MHLPLNDLRDAHASVSASLDALPPDARDWRPAPEAWSATDVLEHLLKTEAGMLQFLRRQLAAGEDRRDLGPRRPGAMDTLRATMGPDQRLRVPPASNRYVAPSGTADLGELRDRWDALPDAWAEQLAAVPPVLTEVGLVPHPLVGPLTASEATQFVAIHARHHVHQLRRLRDALGASSS